MADLKYKPVRHDHAEFLAKARQRPGFTETYDALELEYALAGQLHKARAKAGLTPAPPAAHASAPWRPAARGW